MTSSKSGTEVLADQGLRILARIIARDLARQDLLCQVPERQVGEADDDKAHDERSSVDTTS